MSKVIIVKYTINDAFRVPKDIDLEDKSQVDYWYVKWNVLHIVKPNGDDIQICSQGWIHDSDYKRPDGDDDIENGIIRDAEEYGLEDDSADTSSKAEQELLNNIHTMFLKPVA